MRIDRQRFLLLTASLSAGACTSGAPPSAPPRQAEHVAVAPPDPTTDNPEPETTSAPPPEPVVDAGPPSREGAQPATPAATTVSLSTDPKCNDMKGAPGRCQFKAPGPQCESFQDLVSECQLLLKHLKPKVAERAVNCLSSKSGTPAICEFALPSRCASEAIVSGVCPDKAAAKACAPLVSKCGSELPLDTCIAGYSAVVAGSRKKMLSCMNEFCTIENCLYQL